MLIEQELVDQSPKLLVSNLFAEQTEASFLLLSLWINMSKNNIVTNIYRNETYYLAGKASIFDVYKQNLNLMHGLCFCFKMENRYIALRRQVSVL
jgi:hypothetical protein